MSPSQILLIEVTKPFLEAATEYTFPLHLGMFLDSWQELYGAEVPVEVLEEFDNLKRKKWTPA